MAKGSSNWVPGEAQRRYARVLEYGAHIGFAVLVLTFGLYLGGVIPAAIPPAALRNYWRLPACEYIAGISRDYPELGGAPVGWQWLRLVGHSDYMNLIGVAILIATTSVCFLAIIPTLYRQGRRTYLAIAILEVLVLALAASGLLWA